MNVKPMTHHTYGKHAGNIPYTEMESSGLWLQEVRDQVNDVYTEIEGQDCNGHKIGYTSNCRVGCVEDVATDFVTGF
jgi:hypothetical protein